MVHLIVFHDTCGPSAWVGQVDTNYMKWISRGFTICVGLFILDTLKRPSLLTYWQSWETTSSGQIVPVTCNQYRKNRRADKRRNELDSLLQLRQIRENVCCQVITNVKWQPPGTMAALSKLDFLKTLITVVMSCWGLVDFCASRENNGTLLKVGSS